MAEPFYTTALRVLHVGGGWLAFGAAPIGLLALKGGRRPRDRLVLLRSPRAVLARDRLLGSSHRSGLAMLYRWDRVLIGVGALGSLSLIGDGLSEAILPWSDVAFGGVGLGIAVAHARWRGPRDPSRWQVEHLTSLLAAYAVVWSFILAQYVRVLPEPARFGIPVLGVVAILWARRRVGRATDPDPAAPAPTGAV